MPSTIRPFLIQGGGGATPYDYGWPAGGTSESGVLSQWIFNEASGNILDQVGSIDLTPTQVGATSYIAYNVTIGHQDAAYSGVSPGVYVLNRTSNSWVFLSSDTTLAPGTGSMVIEWVSQYLPRNNAQSDATILYTCNNSINQGLYFYYDSISTTPRFNFYIRTADAVTFSSATALTTNPFDMKIHKHRVVLNRAGNAEYFIDGVSQASTSMAAIAGKTINCSQVILMGATTSAVNTLAGTLYEMRISSGTSNNSGGPGGG